MNAREALFFAALGLLGATAGGLIQKYYLAGDTEYNTSPTSPSPAPPPLPQDSDDLSKTIEAFLVPSSPPVQAISVDPLYINVTIPHHNIREKLTALPHPLQRQWVERTIKYSYDTGKCVLVAEKATRTLEVYCGGDILYSFRMDLGSNHSSDKVMQGDKATPEGMYRIRTVRDRGETRFYRAFLIDYPNAQDWREFRERQKSGQIPRTASIGGDIEVHGEGGTGYDWTLGCMAVKNAEMDLLFELIQQGQIEVKTPITIVKKK